MSSIHSTDKNKSFLIATLLYGTLLLILFFIRFWPPYNQDKFSAMAGGGGGGVTVNFGDSDLGSGANYKSEVLDVKNNAKQAPAKATPEEAIITQENTADEDDRVVISTKEKPKKNTPVVKPEEKPVPQKPKVSNSTNDALSSILKGSNKGGDGDDKTAGNKGKAGGSLSSKDYYGTGGSDKPIYWCGPWPLANIGRRPGCRQLVCSGNAWRGSKARTTACCRLALSHSPSDGHGNLETACHGARRSCAHIERNPRCRRGYRVKCMLRRLEDGYVRSSTGISLPTQSA